MSLPVDLLSGAQADAQSAFSHFEEAREGLGMEFSAAVDRYLDRIAGFPQIAPVYHGTVRRQVI